METFYGGPKNASLITDTKFVSLFAETDTKFVALIEVLCIAYESGRIIKTKVNAPLYA